MEIQLIGFIPPIIGVEGDFNTFRLGRKLGYLAKGVEVFLSDQKRQVVFGRAIVLETVIGSLDELCEGYAAMNHTELAFTQGHAERLYQTLTKIYGPHIVKPNKTATVITLRRVE